VTKRAFSAIFSAFFMFTLFTSLLCLSAGGAQEKELRLICEKGSMQIENMHWSIYRIGERSSSGFVLTGRFADYPVNVSDINEENVRGIAQALESFVVGDELAPDAEGLTDAEGAVSFKGIEPGLYLAIPRKLKVGTIDYRSTPLLAEITVGRESVFPKVYSSVVVGSEDAVYAVKKVWLDKGNAMGARPSGITVDLYGNGKKTDTVTLDETNGWMHTWSGLDADLEWRVVERNVPEGYTVMLECDLNQFLLKDVMDEGTVTTGTTTSSQTTVTSAGKDDDIPKTGQPWLPVFYLSVGGLVLIGAGLLVKRRADKDEK